MKYLIKGINVFSFFIFLIIFFNHITFALESNNTNSLVFENVNIIDESNSSAINFKIYNLSSNLKNKFILVVNSSFFKFKTYLNKNFTLIFNKSSSFDVKIFYFDTSFNKLNEIYFKNYNRNNDSEVNDFLKISKVCQKDNYIYFCFNNNNQYNTFFINLNLSKLNKELLFTDNNLVYSAYKYNHSCFNVYDLNINSFPFTNITLSKLIFFNKTFLLNFYLDEKINLNYTKDNSTNLVNNKNISLFDIYFGNVSFDRTSGNLKVIINITKNVTDYYVFKLFYNLNNSFHKISLILPVRNLEKTFNIENFTNYFIVLDYFNTLTESCKSNNIYFYNENYSKKCIKKLVIKTNNSSNNSNIVNNNQNNYKPVSHSHHSSKIYFRESSKSKIINNNNNNDLKNNNLEISKNSILNNSNTSLKKNINLLNSSKKLVNNISNKTKDKTIGYNILNQKRNHFFNHTLSYINSKNNNSKEINKKVKVYLRAGKTLFLFSGFLAMALLMRI